MTPNYIDSLKNTILAADACPSENERRRFLQRKHADIRDAFTALEKSGDWIDIGMMLRVLADEPDQSPAALFASQRSETLCKALDGHRKEIDEKRVNFTLARARALKQNAKSGSTTRKYTDRHRYIETAIRLVWDLCDKDDDWPYGDGRGAEDAYRFIAESYLARSDFALAKGASVPAKKIEALDKAMHWAEKAGDDTLKVRILLERARRDDYFSTSTLGEALKSFIENETLTPSNALHMAVVDRLHELIHPLDNKENQPSELLDSLRRFDRDMLRKPPASGLMTPLYLARAAIRTGAGDISERLTSAVKGLARCLQTQKIWDETVELLKDAGENPGIGGQWEDAALAAWDACQKAEKRIKLSLQLRWYWSRYRDLYDLALNAALNKGDHAKAANIVESAKSRPTIKMRDAEKMLENTDKTFYRLYVESDALVHTDAYASQYERLKKFPPPEKREHRGIDDIPEGWTSVQFHVYSLENVIDRMTRSERASLPGDCKKAATALVSRPDNSFHPVHLALDGLWAAFKRWQDERRTFTIKKTENSLKALCKEAGKALAPVLKHIPTENVLFIPHGFLHLTPLHAALYEGKPLLAKKQCLYLPSWSMAPVKAVPPGAGPNVLLSNFETKDTDLQNALNRPDWKNPHKKKVNPSDAMADINDAYKAGDQPPHLIAFYAHGKGDLQNPYNARLVMADGGLSYQRLLSELPDLQGAKVMLAACESDLVSGNFGLVDEHLSLAGAFLSKNASGVLGALFEMPRDLGREMLEYVIDNRKKPLYEAVRDKQIEWIGKDLYQMSPFRVMGFPYTGGQKNV